MKYTYLIMFLLALVAWIYCAVNLELIEMWISLAFIWIGVLGMRAEGNGDNRY